MTTPAKTAKPPIEAGTVKAILAASSGNLVEWFDFYTYAFFSVYFAEQFFTGTGQTGAWVKSAAVLFVGFLMRPAGGYIFGRLADRKGRKYSMMAAIILMCAGSLMLAVLPTASVVGKLAPWLLLAVRCIQGISVGGEYGSTATYMSEIATEGRRGFYSSFQYVTLIGGQLLASLLAVIMTHTIGGDAITAGWWRLPFVIGAAAAVVSLFLRSSLEESMEAADAEKKGSGTFREVLAYPRAFWVVFGLTCIGSLAFYTFSTYMQKHLIGTSGFSKGEATDMMTLCLFIFMIMQPLIGMWSDSIGRKNSMLIFGAAMVVLPIPIFSALSHTKNPWIAIALILVSMFFLSFYTSISGIVKAEMFPAHVRALGVGFTYAIGNSLFGGSAEMIALSFKQHGHGTWFPLYMTIIAVLGLVAVLFMKDNRIHSTIDGEKQQPSE